ncbi:hypothetical protein Tdes44962_MAKER02437 [Teratosphaeria destructans]|uniref:Uncharacterized protein n=1 Tax=Teratosphaeria destructans TaxID=418781 RepID=A0A9W7STD8_9PEZI|nr:hypothetical protein Tdes44962_MAKER02437 [Teratosphaeria destructans]
MVAGLGVDKLHNTAAFQIFTLLIRDDHHGDIVEPRTQRPRMEAVLEFATLQPTSVTMQKRMQE